MPRSRSIFIQSERVLRRSPLALTWPARLIAPPNSKSFSVSVVLPASGWEMIAKVRRRATSWASGERDGDSAAIARADMGLSLWQGNRGGASRIGTPHIWTFRRNSGPRAVRVSLHVYRPLCQDRPDRRGQEGKHQANDVRTR